MIFIFPKNTQYSIEEINQFKPNELFNLYKNNEIEYLTLKEFEKHINLNCIPLDNIKYVRIF